MTSPVFIYLFQIKCFVANIYSPVKFHLYVNNWNVGHLFVKELNYIFLFINISALIWSQNWFGWVKSMWIFFCYTATSSWLMKYWKCNLLTTIFSTLLPCHDALPQCHLSGAVLHLRHGLGQRVLHPLRHPAVRLRHPPLGGWLHLSCTHLLPAVWRGLPVVVAERPEHRLHRPLHLRLLRFLLPEQVLYERRGAEHRVLRLLSAHRDGLLTDAGQRVVLGLPGFHSLHLPEPEDGLDTDHDPDTAIHTFHIGQSSLPYFAFDHTKHRNLQWGRRFQGL